MIKKSYCISFFSVSLFIITFLLLYQIYLAKKLTNELEQIQQIRTYYIQFLNAVTMHFKKKILEP